tara:strand:+ start:417 stop:635 length:219 start_codon:yes stop_codon:yes gene_type:complete
MTKQDFKHKLSNVKNESFELYVNDVINLSFYYDKEDNTINVNNTEHYSSADYYLFTDENIEKVHSLYKDDCN